MLSARSLWKRSIEVPENTRKSPHEIWINSLNKGLVSYASSASPIEKARLAEKNKPKNSKFPKIFMSGSNVKYKNVPNKKPTNKLIPPKEGLD
jgi:hypothetical protein